MGRSGQWTLGSSGLETQSRLRRVMIGCLWLGHDEQKEPFPQRCSLLKQSAFLHSQSYSLYEVAKTDERNWSIKYF
jgi:hypothetical protein